MLLASIESHKVPFFLSLLLLFCFLFVSSGLFVIDEFVYLIAAEAIAKDGTLKIDNGYNVLSLETLRAAFLVNGPNGLTSPYPSGLSLLNGIAYALGGPRGIIGFNVFVGVLTLFMTYHTVMKIFDEQIVASISVAILALCSFWFEYVFSFESHAAGILIVTCAFFCALTSLENEQLHPKQAQYWALACGTVIGLGVLVRVDTVLILPALVFSATLFSKAPIRMIFAGAIGVLPGLFIASGINEFKFGTLNPLSYGSSVGGISVGGHKTYAGLLIIIFSMIFYSRFFSSRSPLLVFALVFIAAVVLEPIVWDVAASILRGGYALLVDSSYLRLRPDMALDENGLLRVQGWPKMALGQSMPWIAIMSAVPFMSWRKDRRVAISLIWLTVLSWSLAFIVRSWDGGFGSNMRYFLPLFPLLAAVAAKSMVETIRAQDRPSFSLAFGFLLGFFWWFAWALVNPSGWEGAGFYSGFWLLLVVALTFTLGRKNNSARLVVLAAALVVGSINSVRDVLVAQERRIAFQTSNDVLAKSISPPSITVGYPPLFTFQVPIEDGYVGYRRTEGIEIVAEDYEIWADESSVTDVLLRNPELTRTQDVLQVEMGTVTRLELR